jgi:hypothetical protein
VGYLYVRMTSLDVEVGYFYPLSKKNVRMIWIFVRKVDLEEQQWWVIYSSPSSMFQIRTEKA